MVVAVSVVVIGKDFRSSLDQFLESLDQQSLPTSAFELVAHDLGSADGSLERLQQMSVRRPNITLVNSTDGEQGTASWVDACSGEYVLRLDPSHRMFAETLERAYAHATKHDLDALSMRVVQPGQSIQGVFAADQEDLDPSGRSAALSGAVVLVRRSLVSDREDSPARYLPESARVGVLASYPAAVIAADGSEAVAAELTDAPFLRQARRTVSWVEDQLHLELAGVVEGAPDSGVLGGQSRVVALVRNTKSAMTYLLEANSSVTPDDAGGTGWRWQASLTLDVRSAALGSPLSPGLWEVDLHLVGAEATVAPTTVGWMPCPPAVVGRSIVVPSPTESATWQLDVGATTWPLVRNPDPADGTVTESVAGSLLVLRLPRVHVSGAEVIDGSIALGSLQLPAKIVTDHTSARLEGYVSGLANTYKIATQFGAGPLRQSGLALEVANEGAMAVAKVQPAAPATAKAAPAPKAPVKQTAKKAPAKKAAKKKPATKPLTRLQHLRRALPSPLEPVAQSVAKNAVARRLYRRVTKL